MEKKNKLTLAFALACATFLANLEANASLFWSPPANTSDSDGGVIGSAQLSVLAGEVGLAFTSHEKTPKLASLSTTPVPEPSTYIAGCLLLVPLLAQARRLKRAA